MRVRVCTNYMLNRCAERGHFSNSRPDNMSLSFQFISATQKQVAFPFGMHCWQLLVMYFCYRERGDAARDLLELETLILLLHLLFHLCNVHTCVHAHAWTKGVVGWRRRWRCPAVRVFYNQKPWLKENPFFTVKEA